MFVLRCSSFPGVVFKQPPRAGPANGEPVALERFFTEMSVSVRVFSTHCAQFQRLIEFEILTRTFRLRTSVRCAVSPQSPKREFTRFRQYFHFGKLPHVKLHFLAVSFPELAYLTVGFKPTSSLLHACGFVFNCSDFTQNMSSAA